MHLMTKLYSKTVISGLSCEVKSGQHNNLSVWETCGEKLEAEKMFNSILGHSSFTMEDNLKLVSNFSIPSLLGQL